MSAARSIIHMSKLHENQPQPVVSPVETEPPKSKTKKRGFISRWLVRLGRWFYRTRLFGVIVAVMVAAQLTLLWRPAAGVYINALALAILVGLALWREVERPLLVSVAILPVATMINLSLPQTSTFAQLSVFYSALLLLGLIYRVMFTVDYPLDRTKLTWRGYGLALPLMIVTGQALGVVTYLTLRHHYIFDHTSLPLVAATSVVFAVAEETVFRGLIQQRAAQLIGPIMAAILATVLMTSFSVDHTTYLTPLIALLVSAVLAFTYYKKQNLLLTITINMSTKLAYIGLMASFIFRR